MTNFIKRVRRVNTDMTQTQLYLTQIHQNRIGFVSCQILSVLNIEGSLDFSKFLYYFFLILVSIMGFGIN